MNTLKEVLKCVYAYMRKRAPSRKRGQAFAHNLPDELTTGIRLLLWERNDRINALIHARLNSVTLAVKPCHYLNNYSNLASRFISWVCATGIVRFYAALGFIFSSSHSCPLPPLLPGLARMRNLAANVSSSSCSRSISTTISRSVS